MIYTRQHIIKKLADHAKTCFPEECCGIFKCIKKEDGLEIIEIFETKNVSRNKNTGAQIPKRVFRKFSRLAAAQKKKGYIYGIYHSHPLTGTLALSEQDVFSSTLFKLFKRQIILGVKRNGSIQKAYWENKEDNTWTRYKINTRGDNENNKAIL